MASEITKQFGDAGANIGGFSGDPKLADALRDLIDDVSDLRAKYTSLLAKLDADAGVTDVDYASSLPVATQNATKG